MHLTLGLTVVAGVLIVLPLIAVWASHHWRDPPPEKWGIPPERVEAARNSPELVAHRRRIELGVASGPGAVAVTRAIAHGTEAPPQFRAAAYELAQQRVREITAQLPRLRLACTVWVVITIALLAFAFAYAGPVTYLVLYTPLWIGRAIADSPYLARKRLARAEAAVAANAGAPERTDP